MAETESPEINCVYVDTSLGTHLLIPVHNNETVSDFKEKLCKEHHHCFPKLGEINISAVKVQRQNTLGLLLDYHLPDFMCLSMAFEGVSNNCWFVSVDAAVSVVDKCELMDADEKSSDHELLEKNKEIATDSLVLDGYTKNQTLEQDLGTQVAEKKTKKRKLRSPDAGKSGKKPPNHELLEKNKEIASDSLLVDGYNKNQTPEEDLETPVVEKTRKKRKLKALDGEISQKKPLVDVSQSAAAATTVDGSHELCGNVASESSPRENLDDILTKTTGKEIEMGEKSVEDLEGDKTENNDLVSHPANLLDTNSGLTTRPDTEKKKRRKKRSEDDINQSSATAAITASRDIVNEINAVPDSVDRVEATPESLSISRGSPLAEANQKENDMAENSLDDVARDKPDTDNLESHTEIHLDSNNLEKETKKRQKKSSDDGINLSSASAATIITSRDILDQINEVPANVDPVDAAPESLPISKGENLDILFAEAGQKENEMVEKSVEDVGRDNTETDNVASRPENHLDTNSVLTTRADTEKKKKRKKSSKDDINGVSSTSAAITTSKDIVNEINGVPSNVDPVDATPASLPMSNGNPLAESSQKGNEMVEKIDDDVGSGKAMPSAEDNIQTNNVEVDDADGTKSVKPTKKRKSKKAKTLTEEDTPVASGTQNIEASEAVDGEGTDNVIRNILDSLQEKNETEGDLDRTGKKSSKKSKKKHSSKVVEVLSVEVKNAALEETPLINNPKDADALFTPIKKDAESDASLLKKSPEIAEDNSLSKKSPIEKVDMGDNFGCSPNKEKQDQVAGGAKSKKEKKKKKGLDLHPSGSIAGSLNSVKPKEKKARGQQPASSGASHLKSMVKSGRSGSVKTTVSSKKQEVKKSSKPVAVDNKRKTNFFENAEKCNSSEDEYNNKTCDDVSTKTPSDYSSDNDSDVTSMSRKQQGNNLSGGANKFSGSLQDLLRRSSSYKKALIRAQSQPDIDDDSPIDCVPDSQGV